MNKRTILLIAASTTVVIVVLVLIFLRNKENQDQPAVPIPASQQTWGVITPGKSTIKEVEEQLGQPLDISEQENGELREYESSSPALNHSVIFKNGQAEFLLEKVTIFDSTTTDDLFAQLGKEEAQLFSEGHDPGGFRMFAYPAKGIAFVGNSETGDLLEVWYFPPTTMALFLEKWAPDYYTDPFDAHGGL